MEDKDITPLSQGEIEEKIKQLPSGWYHHENMISKEFNFKGFTQAVEFVLKLAPFCNRIDHHPDVHIYFKKIRFDLTRFSVGGKVTDRDFTVAKKIEELYQA